MFGSTKPQTQTEIKPGPVFDPKTIPAHTMQDDLDILSGKIKAPVAILSEDKNAIPGNSAGINSLKSSPFMQASAPAPASIPNPPLAPALSVNKIGINQGSMATVNNNVNIAKEPINKGVFGKSTGITVGLPSAPMTASKEVPSGGGMGKMVGILAGVLVLLGSLGGGYYFYMTRYNSPGLVLEVPSKEVNPEVVSEEVSVVIPEKFSADKPNYLVLDVEKITAEDIQKVFIQKTVEIKEDKKTVPIEFVVTDLNNNPIALKIFALLMKIDFSPKLLADFQDEFSIYIFLDGENTRLGLNISPKDATKVMADMKAEEKLLVKNLNSLFLGETAKNQTASFQDAQYKNINIRYINLNEQNNLSIDYFMVGDELIVANSKNATWAIIDKIASLKQ